MIAPLLPNKPDSGRSDALPRGGDYFRDAFNYAALGMGLTDLHGRILSVNPAYASLTGYTQQELFCREFQSFIHPDDHAASMDQVERLLAEEFPSVVIEKRLVRKDGALVWVKVTLSLARDPEGSLIGIIAATEDITERKQAEASQCQEQERFRSVVKSLGAGLLIIDLDDTIQHANPRMAQITGYSLEEMIGRKTIALLPLPEKRIAMDEPHPDKDSGDATIDEISFTHKDESPRWLEIHSVPFHDEAGEIVGTLATCTDITERKRIEAALEAERDFTHALLESLQEGIVACDADGTLTLFNRRTREFHGLPQQPLPPERWAEHFDLFHADGLTSMQIQDIPLFRALQGEAVRDAEMVIAPRFGPARSLLANGQAIHGANGERLGAVVAMHDVTERRQVERELARLAAIVESSEEAILGATLEGTIVAWNEGAERLYGYADTEIIGQHASVLAKFNQKGLIPAVVMRLRRGEVVEPTEGLHTRKDGTEFYAVLSFSPIRDAAGHIVGLSCVTRDITTRKNTESALRESERRLRLALESGQLGIWDIDLTTGQYFDISTTCKAHYGLPPEAHFSDDAFYQAVHPEDRDRVRAAYAMALEGHQDYGTEYRVVWPDGSVHWIRDHSSPIYDEAGQAVRMVGATQEITEFKRAEAQREQELFEAQEQADRDPLTGLLNHRAFYRRLEEEESRAHREGTPSAVVMLDLDNFKFFNDCYGHVLGDQVLRQIAARLRAVCRPYDTLARFGGDEFALLLPGVGETTCGEIEARLRTDLGGLTCCPDGQETVIPLSISLGSALLSPLGLDRHGALQAADERLRRAKTGAEVETEADEVRVSARGAVAGFSMLDALVTAVDNKDRYTRGHSEDVMEYSRMIAQELEIDEATLQTIGVAALLHDVGKIGVPDAILRKPGKLTVEEYEAIKQHPTMGAAIVSTVPGLEGILDAVRHHHECWDGSGYPAGLRGKETPLLARLMAVADAFSAMTTDRPYRSGMDPARALSLLVSGAGTQWDPECVAAFLAAMKKTQNGQRQNIIA